MDRLERIRGCLIGGAVGDALGAPTEFRRWSQIRSVYGDSGIVDFDVAYGRIGAITDDTQMSMFTVEGIVRALEGSLPSEDGIIEELHLAYLRWLATQSLDGVSRGGRGGLIDDNRMWSRRAPGNTCLGALREATQIGVPARNNSKGCGGVMRTAPIGFLAGRTYELGCQAAALTHGHPSGFTSASAVSYLVHRLAIGEPLEVAVNSTIARLDEDPQASEVAQYLRLAVEAAEDGHAGPPTPGELGEGWVGEEALAIAVWAALRHVDEPSRAVRVAANHDGDTDSTSSIAGQIVGAAKGTGWLAEFSTDVLEFRDELEVLAVQLDRAVG